MHVTLTTDAELILQSRQGDREAFRTLVRRYESKVAGIVHGMVGRVPEAADIAQEVFIRFFQGMGEFRGESGVGTYLGRIAINLSLNALQRRQREQNRFMALGPETVGSGSREEEMRREAREIVAKGLQILEPEFRAVIVLRLIEGYSTQETSAILDIPLGTVLSRMSRGQEKLKGIIEKLMQ